MKRVSAQKQARPNKPTASPHTMRPSLSEIRAIFGTAFQIVYSNFGRLGSGILWPATWLAWASAEVEPPAGVPNALEREGGDGHSRFLATKFRHVYA